MLSVSCAYEVKPEYQTKTREPEASFFYAHDDVLRCLICMSMSKIVFLSHRPGQALHEYFYLHQNEKGTFTYGYTLLRYGGMHKNIF